LFECQPITYENCASYQVRDGVTGKCIDGESCNSCPCDSCELDKENGLCVCAAAEIKCDATCQANAEKLTILNDAISCYDPTTDTTSYTSLSSINGWSGTLDCSGSECTVISIEASTNGHTALYGPTNSFAIAINCPSVSASSGNVSTLSYGEWGGRAELLATATTSPTTIAQTTGVTQASICLQEGQAVVWDLSQSSADYPTYLKDSALNSNQNFDYSAFLKLAADLNSNITVTFFSFTFQTAGTYVFADADDSSKVTLITVVDSTQACATDSISTLTLSTANQNGVQSNSNVYIDPELIVVAGIVAVFLFMLLIVACYTHLKSKIEEGKLEIVEDDSNAAEFRRLYKKLREQRKFEEEELKKQSKNFEAQCDRMVAETQQLKALLGVKMSIGSTIFLEAAERFVMAEAMAQKSYFDRQTGSNEQGLLEILKRILEAVAEEQKKLGVENDENVPDLTPATVDEIMQHDMIYIKQNAGEVIDIMNRIKSMAHQERDRRDKFKANKGIVGDQLFSMLTRHRQQEQQAEDEFLDTIELFSNLLQNRMDQFVNDQHLFSEKLKTAVEADNDQGIVGAMRTHRSDRRKLCVYLDRAIRKFLKNHERPLTRLNDIRQVVRDSNKAAQNQAFRNIESERQDQQAGLFRGMEPELANAIKLFIKDFCGELKNIKIPGAVDFKIAGAKPGQPGYAVDDVVDATADGANELDAIAKQQQDAEDEKNRALLEEMQSNGATDEELKEAERKLKLRGNMMKDILQNYKKKLEDEEEAEMNKDDRKALAANRLELKEKECAHHMEREKLLQELKEEEKKRIEAERRKAEVEHAALEREKKLLENKISSDGTIDTIREHEIMLDGLSTMLDKDVQKRQSRITQLKVKLKEKLENKLARLKAEHAEEEKEKKKEIATATAAEKAVLEKELESLKKRNKEELLKAKTVFQREDERRIKRENEALEKVRQQALSAAQKAAKAARENAERNGNYSLADTEQSLELKRRLEEANKNIAELKIKVLDAKENIEKYQHERKSNKIIEVAKQDQEEAIIELKMAQLKAEKIKKELKTEVIRQKEGTNAKGQLRSEKAKALNKIIAQIKLELKDDPLKLKTLRQELSDKRQERIERLELSNMARADIEAEEEELLRRDAEIIDEHKREMEKKQQLLETLEKMGDTLEAGEGDENAIATKGCMEIDEAIEETKKRLAALKVKFRKRARENVSILDNDLRRERENLQEENEKTIEVLQENLRELKKSKKQLLGGKEDEIDVDELKILLESKIHSGYLNDLKDNIKAFHAALQHYAIDFKAESPRLEEELKKQIDLGREVERKLNDVEFTGKSNGFDSEAVNIKVKELGKTLLQSIESSRTKNKKVLDNILSEAPMVEQKLMDDLLMRQAAEIKPLENERNRAVEEFGVDSQEAKKAQSALESKRVLHPLQINEVPEDTAAYIETKMRCELKHQLDDRKRFQHYVVSTTEILGHIGEVISNSLKALIQSDIEVIIARMDMYDRMAVTRRASKRRSEAKAKELEAKARRNGMSDAEKARILLQMQEKSHDRLNEDLKDEADGSQRHIQGLISQQASMLEKQKGLIGATNEENLVRNAVSEYSTRLDEINKKMLKEKGIVEAEMERIKAQARSRRKGQLKKMEERQAIETDQVKEEIKKIKNKAKNTGQANLDIPGIDMVYKLNKFLDDSRLGLPQNLDEPWLPREYKAQVTENTRLREQLREQHFKEQLEICEKLNQDISTAIDHLTNEIESQNEIRILEKGKDLKESKLTKEEQILELERIQNEMDGGLDYQVARLRERMEADKRARTRALAQNHKKQVQAEEKMSQKALDSIIEDRIKVEEKKVLRGYLNERNRKTAKRIIGKVMHPRHSRELKDQHIEHFQALAAEISRALDEAMAELESHKREIMEQAALDEIDDLQAEQIINDLEDELNEDEIKLKAEEKLSEQQDQAVTDLRRNHFEEIKTYFKIHYPDEDFDSPKWKLPFVDMQEVMRKMEAEKEKRRQKAQEELRKMEARIEAEKKSKEEALKEEMKKFDEDMKKYERTLQERMKEQVDKEMSRQDNELDEFKKQIEGNKNLSQEDREAQIKAYMENASQQREKLRHQIDAKKNQLQNRLKQKMEEQRRRRAKQREAEIAAEAEKKRKEAALRAQKEQLEKENRERELKQRAIERFVTLGLRSAFRRRGIEKACKKMLLVLGIEVKTKEEKEALERAEAKKKVSASNDDGKKTAKPAGSKAAGYIGGYVGGGQAGSVGAPFLDKLQSMEKVMLSLLKHEGLKTPRGLGEKKKIFVDDEESKFKCVGTSPIVIPDYKLTGRQQVALKFGRRVADVLSMDHVLKKNNRSQNLPSEADTPLLESAVAAADGMSGGLSRALPINIVIAKLLPAKPPGFPSHANAFYNSFHYDAESRTVYIRAERARTVGEFAMVLIHIIAHVRSGTWADTDLEFGQEFYRALQQLCTHLFFTTAEDVGDRAADATKAADALVESKLSGTSADPFFSKTHMHRRMRSYLNFLHSARLKAHLSILEERVAKASHSKLRSRIKGVVVAEGAAADMKDLENRLIGLEDESDKLNKQLVIVVAKMRSISNDYIASLDKSKDQLTKADIKRLYTLQDSLSRLDGEKAALLKRIAAAEAWTTDIRSEIRRKKSGNSRN